MESATKDGVHTWGFSDQIWQQTPDGRFSLRSIAGISTSDSVADLDFLAGARLAPGSSTDYLPSAFKFCPNSGAEVLAPDWNSNNRWLPPYGEGSGSRVIAHGSCEGAQRIVEAVYERVQGAGTRDLNGLKQVVEPPRTNGLSFFVANVGGYRDALFALDRTGCLFLWQRAAGTWSQLKPADTQIGPIVLDNWAWSVALRPGNRGHDLLIPGDAGAVLVTVDVPRGQYRAERYEGKSLGGPGELEGCSWLPLRMADGSVQLVGRNGGEWQVLPIAGRVPDDVDFLSAPVSDPASARLLWIGKHGYLSLSRNASLEAQWLAWPNGATARPEMGPPFLDGNGLWQLIFESESHYYLQLDARATGRSEPIKGYRLSTGHLSFKYSTRLTIPWREDNDSHREPMIEEVIYPFMEFREGKYLLSMRDKSGKRINEFLNSTESLRVQYCLDKIDGFSLSLEAVVREPWKAQWFFFDNAMWLYIDSSGALYRWTTE